MKKIVIMAGGTGGHVFPGLALAKAFQDRGIAVSWLGTQGGMEKEWVERAGLPFHAITIQGLRGKGWKGWLIAPWRVLQAWGQARTYLKLQRPDAVLGMGGFVCGPGGLAARTLGIDLILHEQNAIPGMTNRWLAPLAKRVITAFPQTTLQGAHVIELGNPVREGFEAIATVEQKTSEVPLSILVVGGSRGALALNETVPKAIARLPENMRPKIRHQTGSKTLEKALESYRNANVTAEVVPFIDDMISAFAQADLVICRSGALTVSELMAAARPAIMVPFPHAVDDHQTANAKVLADMGGGEVIAQTQLTPELLAQRIQYWQQPNHCANASLQIREHAITGATDKIVEAILALNP